MKKFDLEGKNIVRKIALLSTSPIDGRYYEDGEQLNEYCSEYALIKNRVEVEVKWLMFFLDIKFGELKKEEYESLKKIYEEFNLDDAIWVKEKEKETKHDVKAVEYFINSKLVENYLENLQSYVHIGCTSEDINNLAYALMLKGVINDVWKPKAEALISNIKENAIKYKHISMLAHTHGQPATPTTVGKELFVFQKRLEFSLEQLSQLKIFGKFNGATGNYSAISFAIPDIDWKYFSECFVTDVLGLDFNPVTTQIESHDYMCRIFNEIVLFNNILLGFNRDMWQYISMEYFKQVPVTGEIGSSTMPHKVNPICFENSEANIGMSNYILNGLASKLPVSRMQRDLSDSSAQRNIGVGIAHSLLSIEQTILGFSKVEVNKEAISRDLNNRWEILAEPIQTILRDKGIANAYEKLKELTRGKLITKEILDTFISNLEIPQLDKERLMELTPEKYIGLAVEIMDKNYLF